MAPDSGNGNKGWNEWSRHVLSELKRLNEELKNLRDDAPELERRLLETVSSIRIDISELKTNARIWGAVSGVIAGAMATGAIQFVLASLKK